MRGNDTNNNRQRKVLCHVAIIATKESRAEKRVGGWMCLTQPSRDLNEISERDMGLLGAESFRQREQQAQRSCVENVPRVWKEHQSSVWLELSKLVRCQPCRAFSALVKN